MKPHSFPCMTPTHPLTHDPSSLASGSSPPPSQLYIGPLAFFSFYHQASGPRIRKLAIPRWLPRFHCRVDLLALEKLPFSTLSQPYFLHFTDCYRQLFNCLFVFCLSPFYIGHLTGTGFMCVLHATEYLSLSSCEVHYFQGE